MLERYEPLSLSRDIGKCIASNTSGGIEVLRCLCQKYKDISFSQDQLAAVAENSNGMYLADIILEYDESLDISQLVIHAAASTPYGHEVFFVLMYHNKSLEITWGSLKIIKSTGTVKMFMDHQDCGFKFPDEGEPMFEAYIDMSSHITCGDCKLNFSEQMLQAAARWEPDAIDYLRSHARPNVTFRKYSLEERSIVHRSNTF